ncbi:MAG TPA: hypothetical protein PK724_07940, partial [Pseudomonadales bacterium]|nr:hypothetical protein [Pseudomonadales bacterium]
MIRILFMVTFACSVNLCSQKLREGLAADQRPRCGESMADRQRPRGSLQGRCRPGFKVSGNERAKQHGAVAQRLREHEEEAVDHRQVLNLFVARRRIGGGQLDVHHAGLAQWNQVGRQEMVWLRIARQGMRSKKRDGRWTTGPLA